MRTIEHGIFTGCVEGEKGERLRPVLRDDAGPVICAGERIAASERARENAKAELHATARQMGLRPSPRVIRGPIDEAFDPGPVRFEKGADVTVRSRRE